MANEVRYLLTRAPVGLSDGRAAVSFDVTAQIQPDGEETWSRVSGYHKTILVPVEDLETVNDMPAGGGVNNAAKAAAYVQLLVTHVNTGIPTVQCSWSKDGISAKFEQDAANSQAANSFISFISTTLGLSFPVPFTL